ncbi:MAG: M20/M25/M40 family metallo-hydrolase [Anaerosomatales bacterium]|nr:M20/M25/M40 family metallo-hydrolase [Anaerosomatales bacterium]MDT8433821.1 M20/M25/M40 family metallo-hydrolase [Anaerosomatales bacterium]
MRLGRKALALLIVTAVAIGLMAPAAMAAKPLLPNEMGVRAYYYVQELNVESRVAETAAEVRGAEKVKGWFEQLGYEAEIQPFSYVRGGQTRNSQNVVVFSLASKKPKTSPTPMVIVGAHHDSVAAGMGADDNASGVGAMLEIAERIRPFTRQYDLVFIAFGAEERGLRGADYYVDQMSEEDIERTIAMISFDSLITGDKLYVHAGQANRITWVRDEMLTYAGRHKLPIEIQPGLNTDYPAGFSPGFSDVAVFDRAGIPVAGFEATNWEIDDMDGYTQTEEFGSFWHTSRDNLATIEEMVPKRPMVRLAAFTKVGFEFLRHLKP